jgi:6-pyruvoyltetrahydropterin/6-carboxytetrahydropterin synthase
MKVGVIEHFDSMHLLPGHPKCGVPHGHTYRAEVSVEGPVKDGMVIDFGLLKKTLRETLKDYDHADLNRFLEFPSCENIAADLLGRLKAALPAGRLTVRIWEGEGKWAECDG